MENEVYRAKPERKKIYKWLIPTVLILGIYAFLQAYLMNANSIDTVKATEGYINDSIISQGIICRREKVLSRSGSGVIDYISEDGSRVSKGRLIANVYPSYSDIRNLNFLRNRESMLEDINTVSGFIDYGTVDMTATKKQLSNQLSILSEITNIENFSEINNALSRLTLSLNKVGVATGRITDFNQAKVQLENEISNTKSLINSVQNNLYSPYTGYFMQSSDGYENIATVENFLTMSAQQGLDIINSITTYSAENNAYGKIITDYKWNLCTYVDSSAAENLREGQAVRISVNVKDNSFRKAEVKNIIDHGEKTLVIIRCTDINLRTNTSRITDCEILFKQYNGIKIPKSAIHFDGEQMGVFVNFSNLVQFKKITPIYEDDNYVVVPLENSTDNQVKLHDSIIVKGRNLYDGKYL